MMRKPQLSTLFAFTLLCCFVSSAWASTYQLSHTFQPDDPENAPFFGSAVVLEDGVAAIKSNSGYVDGDGLSTTHVFEEENDGSWSEAAVLAYDSGDNSGNPYLGQELAIDNGEIVISYGTEWDNPTSVHLQFATRDDSGWSVQFNEPTPDPLPGEEPIFKPFDHRLPGRSVDISGNLAIVDDGQNEVARIYQKSEEGLWSEFANLEHNLNDPFDPGSFRPLSVAIDNTTAVVTNRNPFASSQLYFFELSITGDWSIAGEFLDDELSPVAYVEIEGDTAVVLDAFSDEIYLYERISGTWQETQSFFTGGDSRAMAFDNGIIAFGVDPRDNSPRLVNLMRQSDMGTWEIFDTVYDPNPETGDLFGDSLAIDQGRLLVGDWGGEQGVAYLFSQVPEPSAALLAMLASFIGGLQRRTR